MYGLKLDIQKTKIMASSPITSWQTMGKQMEIVETMETVTDFYMNMPGMGVDKPSLHWNAFYFSEWNTKYNFSMIRGLVEVCRHFSMGISLHLDYQQEFRRRKSSFLFLVSWEGCDRIWTFATHLWISWAPPEALVIKNLPAKAS